VASINGISNEGRPLPSRISRRTGTAGWCGVAEPETEVETASPAGGAAAPMALDGLLALQESVGEVTPREPEQDRQARSHGRRLLGALGGLQRLILSDADPMPGLRALQDLVAAEPEQAADPALAAVLAAIRMRVSVELARRGL
jgi:hypothetical protein